MRSFQGSHMATPFFGKREIETPPTPSNGRQGTNTGSTTASGGTGLGGGSLQSASSASSPAVNAKTENDSSNSTFSTSTVAEGGSKLIVGPNIKLKGVEITDCDTLVVEGLVEATMDSRVMQIAVQGAFKGSAEIDVAEIRGEFNGNLTVRQKLVIYSTGKVTGTIRYGKLVIEEGGQLAGEILFGAISKAPVLTQVGAATK